MAKELKKSGMGPNDKDLCDLAEDIDKYEKGQAAKLLVQLLEGEDEKKEKKAKKGKKDKKGKKAKKGKKGGKGKGKGGDEGMEGPEGPEDMPPMGPPPSCAERAFEGLWMATDADGNDNLDAAEFGAVVDYGCAEDSECTPEDAEMAKGWFDEVTGGEPVPKDEVKAFMFEMGAEEFESENDSELCHMADEVEAYLDGECSGGSGGEGPPEVLLQIAKDAAKEGKKGKKGGKKGGKKEKKEKKEGGKKEKKEKKEGGKKEKKEKKEKK